MININVTEILLYYKLPTVICGYWSTQLKGKGIQLNILPLQALVNPSDQSEWKG